MRAKDFGSAQSFWATDIAIGSARTTAALFDIISVKMFVAR